MNEGKKYAAYERQSSRIPDKKKYVLIQFEVVDTYCWWSLSCILTSCVHDRYNNNIITVIVIMIVKEKMVSHIEITIPFQGLKKRSSRKCRIIRI